MNKYRVLIVDDHTLARRAIRSILEADDTFIIVGEATGGLEAIEMCHSLTPDLVLMDIHMKDMSGLEATRQIRNAFPMIKIVMLTVSDAAADLFTALQFGAQGYLLKNMDPEVWTSYLRSLMNEEPDASRKIADRLLNQFQSMSEHPHLQDLPLTDREKQIISCVAGGATNREVAAQLHIAENTVKNHIKNILEKLNLDNRVQLTAFAVKNGLSQFVQSEEDK
ncbi:response regulator [Marinicrinis lubricantis]|uniref:Response regulator n=1 Tax=Marinicrinis lubricantis TaxID=2086470 RepID=A0ABW1IUU3_9BACL